MNKLQNAERAAEPVPTLTPAGKPARPSWRRLVATLLALLAIIGGVSYGAFVVALPFGWLAHPETRLATFLIGAIVGELAALLVLRALLRKRGLSLRALGLGKATNWRGLALGVAVALAYAGVTAALNPAVGSNLLRFGALKVLAVVAALVAGLVEETIFRGYIMATLGQMGSGHVTQVVVSAAVFALAHFYGFVSPVALLTTFAFTLILGAALAVTYLVGKRSLTPVIIGHTLVDLIIEPWLLLSFFTGAVSRSPPMAETGRSSRPCGGLPGRGQLHWPVGPTSGEVSVFGPLTITPPPSGAVWSGGSAPDHWNW